MDADNLTNYALSVPPMILKAGCRRGNPVKIKVNNACKRSLEGGNASNVHIQTNDIYIAKISTLWPILGIEFPDGIGRLDACISLCILGF